MPPQPLAAPALPRAATPALSLRRRVFALALLVIAAPLVAALWSGVTQAFGPPAAWMAVVAVADASLLLQLLRWPPGPARTAIALAFLAVCTAAGLWLSAAGVVGPAFGLLPWESALRMGPVLFEVVSAGWWTVGTVAWLAAAIALGLWWNR